MRHALIIASSLVILTSCGGSDGAPTAPTPNRLAAGTWEGPFTTDAGALAGTLRLVLTQDASGSITGTATLALPGLTVPTGKRDRCAPAQCHSADSNWLRDHRRWQLPGDPERPLDADHSHDAGRRRGRRQSDLRA